MDNTITLFTTRKFTSAKFIINSLVITVLQRYLQCFLQNVERVTALKQQKCVTTIKAQTINNQRADAILGNRACYAPALSTVTRVHLCGPQVP